MTQAFPGGAGTGWGRWGAGSGCTVRLGDGADSFGPPAGWAGTTVRGRSYRAGPMPPRPFTARRTAHLEAPEPLTAHLEPPGLGEDVHDNASIPGRARPSARAQPAPSPREASP